MIRFEIEDEFNRIVTSRSQVNVYFLFLRLFHDFYLLLGNSFTSSRFSLTSLPPLLSISFLPISLVHSFRYAIPCANKQNINKFDGIGMDPSVGRD